MSEFICLPCRNEQHHNCPRVALDESTEQIRECACLECEVAREMSWREAERARGWSA